MQTDTPSGFLHKSTANLTLEVSIPLEPTSMLASALNHTKYYRAQKMRVDFMSSLIFFETGKAALFVLRVTYFFRKTNIFFIKIYYFLFLPSLLFLPALVSTITAPAAITNIEDFIAMSLTTSIVIGFSFSEFPTPPLLAPLP